MQKKNFNLHGKKKKKKSFYKNSKLLYEKRKNGIWYMKCVFKIKQIFIKKLSVLTYKINKYRLYMDYPCCLMSKAILNQLLHTAAWERLDTYILLWPADMFDLWILCVHINLCVSSFLHLNFSINWRLTLCRPIKYGFRYFKLLTFTSLENI